MTQGTLDYGIAAGSSAVAIGVQHYLSPLVQFIVLGLTALLLLVRIGRSGLRLWLEIKRAKAGERLPPYDKPHDD